ncbi:SP family galactose:H+ symporter-like MFS transporter [Allofrancisella inopinata]|uniref:Sugar porter family MFS transporter n=1 Tax=Allofrancisella inopinata TaxID=1085647 RepID=A0AAE6YHY0_9GAMM|nr:sugar porter family MFS transporter [Allofrancisella inopinata]QIV95931.1 sugar porter family MFS transporter [Allofrancisella inopinata]TDT74350.1 SP family galactose:H+ symporter-like MFS transporter [Allofrancisella inopinata]
MESQKEFRKIVIFICIVAALGGLLFGLDQGFIANAGKTLNHIYGIADGSIQEGNFNAILAFGGIAGTLCSGFFTRYLGRKNTLLVAGFSFLIGALVSSLLPPIEILTACRFTLGFGVGLASFATPLYLAETAPTKVRGAMSTLFQLMITFGIFLICLTNVIIVEFVGHTKISLTLMFSVITLFAFLMLVGCFFLPKSPRWLMLKNREEEARVILAKTRKKDEVELEISEIKQKLGEKKVSIAEAIAKKYFWKILFVGIVIQMFQQLVGINMMIYYAPKFLEGAGLNIILAGLMVFFVNFLSTFPAIKWVEKWGRKKLLTVGAIIMMVSLLIAAYSFYLIDVSHTTSNAPKYVLLVFCLVYIFGFACSWGPVAWTLCSEIFPQRVREVGLTVTTIVNWTFVYVVVSNSNVIMSAGEWGKPLLFIVYAGFCLLSIIFLKFFVPETKGISLEKIESNLVSGSKLRDLGKE